MERMHLFIRQPAVVESVQVRELELPLAILASCSSLRAAICNALDWQKGISHQMMSSSGGG
jgi:hypothetical protein